MKSVLITGGTGFIGSRLALRLAGQGGDVRILAQKNNTVEEKRHQLLIEAGTTIVLGSVTDRAETLQATDGVDLVFHLAAAQHEMNVPDEHFRNVNVEGTRNVLEAAMESGVSRVVHGSTIGVYGAPNGEVDEKSPTTPINIYGTTKLEGEHVALSYAQEIPTVCVRIPETYGPGDRRLLKLFRAVRKGTFFIIGTGSNLHHPIYIDDLVEGLMLLGVHETAPGELFLLGGKDVVTTNEMVQAVAEAMDRPPPKLRLPMAPFLAIAIGLEALLRPLGVQPPLHRRRLDFFRRSFQLSADKAKKMLNFSPEVGFAEGARRTAEWYEEVGLL